MKKRAKWEMVDEDDPQFCRFWDAYPRRVSKKDARKAWAQLNPTIELVDKILAALAWQVPAFKWDGPNQDYAPYPASWLNGERWTDERRQSDRRADGPKGDYRGHYPPCITSSECMAKWLAEQKASRAQAS